ncbi:MAG: type II/IV secretion system protein [Phycisphaerae bacterium]|nr:type II/IV secretion system protein [Phycisphaerae bacterium]
MLDHDDFVLASLLESGRVTAEAAEAARQEASREGIAVTESLLRQGVIDPRGLAIARAETYECPFVDLSHFEIDFTNCGLLPRGAADSLIAFPLFVMPDLITVGMANPIDLRAVDQLRGALKSDIEPVLCEPGALRALIERAYALSGNREEKEESVEAEASPTLTTGKEPIVAAMNQIISQAIERGASDIHIGPDEHDLHLRYRIDGTLHEQQGPGLSAHSGLIRRLKIMANLDLTQTRRPQDGKIRFTHAGRTVDIRLSIIPTVCGENAVMRLLTSSAAIRGFDELGLSPAAASAVERAMGHPHGMILVTGPTGSGKTTTVYTGLKKLNTADRNIMTIEDPVEIRMPLIRQVQVNTEIGMTFAGALRSILRQDPDVVFVGEIRDEETARIAVQSALTGHLVLSTLHTNDAAGAIPRLRDFNCPPFAINAALLCVIAQRLVRRVCPECAVSDRPDASAAAVFGIRADDGGFVRGEGCSRCARTGYKGRIGVYEVLQMNPSVQRAVESGGDATRVRRAATSTGMQPMWQDALEKARLGLTTLEEAARVVAVHSVEPEDACEAEAPPSGGSAAFRSAA